MLNALSSKAATLASGVTLMTMLMLGACSGTQSTTPGVVVVTVSPSSVSLLAGATQQFTAIVSGTSNSKVTWQVNGTNGGSSGNGTISSNGLYTAPASVPGASVTVTAVSVADPSVSASASVNFSSSISLNLSPSATTVPTNGSQLFTATVSGAASGGGSLQLGWSVNGIPGGNNTLGTISSNSATTAVYVAPSVIPAQSPVTIAVESVSDTLISASASVTIACGVTNSITPSSTSVTLGDTQSFSASLCVAQGSSIAWDVNGTSGGNTAVGTIVSTSSSAGASTATYTAPATMPMPPTVTIHAVSGSASAAAALTLVNNVSIIVTPANATVAPSGNVTLTPTVTGSANANVTWTVNGAANGDAAAGQICEAGSNPCTTPAGGFAGSVVYIAPALAPSQNPVTVVATSAAAPSQSAASTITISSATNTTAATVAPLYLFIAATGGAPSTQQFFARDSSGANATVSWSVASAVVGAGCTGSACGSISATGLYTAPPNAPSPNAISVVASSSNPPATLTATVAIVSGVTIEAILPSSVSAGSVEGFPLELEGVNFVAGSGATASAILINGAARATTCPATNSCATPLNPSDVAAAETLTVQIQNPNGALSNPVPFVVAQLTTSPSTLKLSAAQTATDSIQLTVAEPTTAASGLPINVNFIGMLTDNSCTIGAAPVTVTRPASGTSTVSICVQGDGLDPAFTYSFGGPAGAATGTDIPVTAAAVPGLLPNMIELNLELSSGASPGLRTLFISTLNGDRASATGMLEVQ